MNRSNWIPLHSSLTTHPKFLRLAATLQIDKFHTLWHLTALWKFAQDNAADGDISGYDAEEIALVVEWEGNPEDFIAALRKCKFLDGSGDEMFLHDWHDYGGKLESRRQGNAERARRKYLEEKQVKTESEASTSKAESNVKLLHPQKTPNIDSKVAMELRKVCKKPIMLSQPDRKKMEEALMILESQDATPEQMQEFGRKVKHHWTGRDAKSKKPAPPGILQVAENWQAVLEIDESEMAKTSGVLSDAELDALAAEFQ